jgi:hypothetical protein
MAKSSQPPRRSLRAALTAFTIGITLFTLGGIPVIAVDTSDHGCGAVVSAAAQSDDNGDFDNHGQMVSDTARACAAQQGQQGGSDEDTDDQAVQAQAQQGSVNQDRDQDQDTDQGGRHGQQGENHGHPGAAEGKGKH